MQEGRRRLDSIKHGPLSFVLLAVVSRIRASDEACGVVGLGRS
jgi:hypothetical protein